MFQEVRQQRRSLRDVLPRKEIESRTKRAETPPPAKVSSRRNRSRSGSSKLFLVLSAVIVVVVIIFVITSLFASAKITVTPKMATFSFASTTIPYGPVEVMTLQPITDSRVVEAKGTETVSERASGTIVVFNNTSVAQKLVKNTRFQTSGGKIFRINEVITVPAAKTSGGKTTPGSIEAVITADEPGAAYNSGLTDFTIPGFKGDPRFTKIYARSKTPLSGGASGLRAVISEADKDKIHEELRQALTSRALDQARAQIPENFIVYNDAVFITFDDQTEAVAGATSSAKISTTATLKALLFDRAILTEKLAATQATALSELPFTMPEIEKLNISLANKNSINLSADKSINLLVNGATRAIAAVDKAKLAEALAGKDKGESTAIFSQFPTVESWKITFRPPWLGHFPKTVDENRVVIAVASQTSLTP